MVIFVPKLHIGGTQTLYNRRILSKEKPTKLSSSIESKKHDEQEPKDFHMNVFAS